MTCSTHLKRVFIRTSNADALSYLLNKDALLYLHNKHIPNYEWFKTLADTSNAYIDELR